MIGTFVRLAAWSIKNRTVSRLRRLRQPRYLAGLVLGLTYFYTVILRYQLHAARSGRTWLDAPFLGRHVPDIVAVVGLVLWLVTVVMWLVPLGSTWRFTGAEVQFLYTAPVPRRSLLQYKLLRGQIGIVFGVLVGAFFSGVAYASPSARWAFLLGGWMLLATMSLHVVGISLAKTRLRSPASRGSWQAWAPVGLFVVLSGALVIDAARRVHALPSASLARTFESLLDILRSGIARVALWPFTVLVTPFVAPTLPDLFRALLPVLVLAALNYAWVLRADSAAADATLATEKRQARTAPRARVPVVRAQPFTLASSGRPEVAILWKNLILLGRYASLGTLFRVLVPLGVLAIVVGLESGSLVAAPIALAVAVLATVLGPMAIRSDLREDLPRLAVLKTWPVRGHSLLAGELAAPVVVLSTIAWTGLGVAVVLSGSVEAFSLPAAQRGIVALAAALVAPALIVGQLVVQNAAVILLPGWVPTGGARARGIEATGQNLLVFVGTSLALALGLLPAVLAGAGTGVVFYALLGLVSAVLAAAVVVTAVLLAEAALAVFLLGRMLERTEPSHVELAD